MGVNVHREKTFHKFKIKLKQVQFIVYAAILLCFYAAILLCFRNPKGDNYLLSNTCFIHKYIMRLKYFVFRKNIENNPTFWLH